MISTGIWSRIFAKATWGRTKVRPYLPTPGVEAEEAESQTMDRRRQTQSFWLAGAAIILVALATTFAWLQFRENDDCRSARPTIQVVPGEGLTKDSPLIVNLINFLDYYPILSVVHGDKVKCEGVPRFALTVREQGPPGGQIKVALRNRTDGRVFWAQDYVREPTPGHDPNTILAARIAYQLGKPVGELEAAAVAVPWNNERAWEEFACLNSFNQIYDFVGEADVGQVYECLEKYAFLSSNENMPATFVNMDLYMNADLKSSEKVKLSKNGQKALSRAKKMNPMAEEVLMLNLEMNMNEGQENNSKVLETTKHLFDHYRYNPNALQFVSYSCGSEIDDYNCSLKSTNLIELIDSGRESYAVGRIFANVGAQKWEKLVVDRAEIMNLHLVEEAVIALAMAPHGPDPESDREEALARLSRDNLNDLYEIERMIANLEYSDKVKTSLFIIAEKNFSDNEVNYSNGTIL